MKISLILFDKVPDLSFSKIKISLIWFNKVPEFE